jgi:hypothetical protein
MHPQRRMLALLRHGASPRYVGYAPQGGRYRLRDVGDVPDDLSALVVIFKTLRI